MQQQELITKKIEESKQKIKDQQEQKKTKTDDSASYLVSEKIYQYFSKHALLYQMNENTYEKHLKEVIKEAVDKKNDANKEVFKEE